MKKIFPSVGFELMTFFISGKRLTFVPMNFPSFLMLIYMLCFVQIGVCTNIGFVGVLQNLQHTFICTVLYYICVFSLLIIHNKHKFLTWKSVYNRNEINIDVCCLVVRFSNHNPLGISLFYCIRILDNTNYTYCIQYCTVLFDD